MPPRRRTPPDDDSPPYGQVPTDEEPPENEDSLLVHEAYLQHRLGGGEPATPEAFQRAVEQFERLPGALRTGPSAARTPTPPPSEPPPAADVERGEPPETPDDDSGDVS